MPQPKKDPSLRARRNKASSAATLTITDTYSVPALPTAPDSFGPDGELIPGGWHPRTIEWWTDIWESPLPGAWQSFDVHGLYVLALLYDDIWTAKTAKERKDAAGEYRLQRAAFFIAPYERMKGEIVFAEADAAKAQVAARRQSAAAIQPATKDDPRQILGQ